MAATPSAEWDRLKWRRRHDVRRQAYAPLMGGKICVTPARGSGRSPREEAGQYEGAWSKRRVFGSRGGFTFRARRLLMFIAVPSAFDPDGTHARYFLARLPFLQAKADRPQFFTRHLHGTLSRTARPR